MLQLRSHQNLRLPALIVIMAALALLGWGGIALFSAASSTSAPITATPTPGPTMATPTSLTTDDSPPPLKGTLTTTPIIPSSANTLPLAGHRIGLDPGHGPRGDLGAVSVDPNTGKLILSEAEFNLDVAKRCRDILVERGADVVLTREDADTFTSPWPNDANGDGIVGASGDDLQTRVDILNDFHAEVFLSIHANSLAESKSAEDLQIIYCGSDCAHPAESKRLGDLVLSQLTSQLAAAGVQVNKGAVLADLDVDASNPPLHMFVLGPPTPPRHVRSTNMAGVLGETLYVSQPVETKELLRDDVRQAIALGYANALQEFLIGTPGK
jgi:N-acetylmuramoyl-L-alanine amidase